MLSKRVTAALAVTVAAGAVALATQTLAAPASVTAAVPRPDHVVVAIFENKNYTSIVGSSSAPYLNSLAAQGALFTNSFGLTHPSQPNYIGLFSGSLQSVSDDSCPQTFTGKANLGSQLIGAGFTFAGYSENMPSDGYTGCSSGNYARKHNPWVDFDNVPAASNLRFSRFPADFTQLPAVSFVVPDMCNDMHDCSVATGDTWLRNNLDAYAQWAKTHNSLLIVTFDEDNFTSVNQIATVFVGQQVRPGSYGEQINHYSVLRTLEDAYGLPALNNAATATPITDIWASSSPSPSASPSSSSPPPASGCTATNGTDMVIPDQSTVNSPVTISGCPGNAAANSSVEVHIKHTYIGDLVVSLAAPDGSVYVLQNRTGGSTHDINTTYTVNLSAEVANGTWQLRVQDAAAQDTGSIDSWTLNLAPAAACTGTNPNDVQIPDQSTVDSSIVVSGCTGNASASSTVEVHIVHTYRGDLVVTLVAPDGSTYSLLNRSGGSADNVDQTFAVNLSSEVRNGTWKLRVQDAAAQDTGHIDSWTLTL